MGKQIKELDLTQREIEVVEYLANGLTAGDIGKKMFLSKRTIEQKILWARTKNSADNVTHLVAKYYENKIEKISCN